MRYDRAAATATEVSPGFDRSVEALAWSPDSSTSYFNAEDRAYEPLFSVPAAGGTPRALTPESINSEWALSADGKTFVMARSSQSAPAELVAPGRRRIARSSILTHHNQALLDKLDLATCRAFHVRRRRRHRDPRHAAPSAGIRRLEEIPGRR